MEDKFKEQLETFKTDLRRIVEKSQESFEKQLSYISAGAFGVTIAFIDKIVGNLNLVNFKWVLIAAWSFLGITFIINLFSHIVAAKYHYKTIEEIEIDSYDVKRTNKRTRRIHLLNYISIGTLLVGIALIIIFIWQNI